ncbi:MAG: hypothetical protein N2316_04605 [Spirochaetes bacterium]|nr:hypothetical protein [Spirochaetota bacterium]
MKRRRINWWLVGVMMIIFIASQSCGKSNWIVKIDGETITLDELNELYYAHHKNALMQIKFDITNEDIDKFASDVNFVKKLPTLNKEIFLNEVINQRIMYNKAVQAGVLDKPEVKAMIKVANDTAVVQYYIRERFKNEIGVTDQEVETFYNENRAKFKAETIEQAEKMIRQYLATQKLLFKMKKFVDELKDSARIERNPDYEKMLQTKTTPSGSGTIVLPNGEPAKEGDKNLIPSTQK